MKKGFKKQFSFFPDTWMLPSESLEFKNQVGKFRNRWFILKPAASCQGKGIFLTNKYYQIDQNEKYIA